MNGSNDVEASDTYKAMEALRLMLVAEELGGDVRRTLAGKSARLFWEAYGMTAGAIRGDAGLREWAGPARRTGGERPERLDW